MGEEQSSGKNFFSTIPGIITAVAGLITAVGGLILILNKDKAGNDTAGTEQFVASDDTIEMGGEQWASSVSYTPNRIKHTAKGITYEIEGATAETSEDETKFQVNLRCINSLEEDYEFYSTYLEAKVDEKIYKVEPYRPSGGYQSIPSNGSMPLEFTIKLPAGTKTFSLDFWDDATWINSAEFTLE